MKKTTLLILTFIGITLFACKKTPDNNNVIPINDALKAAFNFQPGTYWIYKDSLTGAIDSFFVTSNEVGSATNYPYNVDFISIYISEYTIGTISSNDTQGWNLSYQSNMIDLEYVTNKVPSNKISYSPLVNYPFLDCLRTCSGCIIGGEYGQNNIVNIFNSFPVDGRIFENVAEVSHSANLAPFEIYGQYNSDDTFYICPDVGIIKMSLNHPQDSVKRIWEIQRYIIK